MEIPSVFVFGHSEQRKSEEIETFCRELCLNNYLTEEVRMRDVQCPLTPEIWQRYQDTGDSQVAGHLASCAACRTEAGRLSRLQEVLAVLPAPEVPGEVASRMEMLATATQEKSLTCKDVLAILDRWLEGELDPAQSFLVEDHLLWCEPCTLEVAKAETLLVAMRSLPQMTAPAAIAERIEQARVPWWKRLLPAPAPVWTRQAGFAASLAAGLVLAFFSTLLLPQMAQTPFQPKGNTQVAIVTPVQSPVTQPVEIEKPVTPSTATLTTPTLRRPVRTHHRHPVVRVHNEIVSEPETLIAIDVTPKNMTEGTKPNKVHKVPAPAPPAKLPEFASVDSSAKDAMTRTIARGDWEQTLSETDTNASALYN